MCGQIGPWEWVAIIVVLLLIFGASRIKGLGKALGEGIKEFKKATKEIEETPEKTSESKPKEPTESKKSEDNN